MPWNWISSWSSGLSPRGPFTNSTRAPAAGELLDQQRLVGELAGQPVRRVDQHHVQAALGGQVPQRFQGRAGQRRAGVPLVGEHPLTGTSSRPGRGVLAQGRELGADRLVLRLPGAGDPRVDRRCRHGLLLPAAPAAVLARRCGTNIP